MSRSDKLGFLDSVTSSTGLFSHIKIQAMHRIWQNGRGYFIGFQVQHFNPFATIAVSNMLFKDIIYAKISY